ncbi:MAG TPA: BolA/IbaG family iron-sulfur metabolism protein [Alphaproteobacteria bacterium]|nr:BolA/IbaG family iron-sulfur metabolism protein [Alphaproteobacteria bacterium]
MPLSPKDIETLLKKNLPGCDLTLKDLAGDNDHFQLLIIASQFEGLNRIQRHQLVYAALEGHMGTTLHALSFKAISPKENGDAS